MNCPVGIVSDVTTIIISEKFKIFSRWLSIHHMVVVPSGNHQSNGPEVACRKCFKRTMKKYYETNAGIYVSMQIRSTMISPRYPRIAMLLFNRSSRGTLLRFSRLPIVCNNDDKNHFALRNRQPQTGKDVDTHIKISLHTGSPVAAQ